MRIITIGREFGSGGRELGKRLADALGYAYYDREILTAIAQKSNMDEGYVSKMMEQGLFSNIPITFGQTFHYTASVQQNATQILIAQQHILKELAEKGDCVIVGRSADVILQDHDPLNIFVYANTDAKLRRCKARAPEGEDFSEKQMKKKMKQVDNSRAKAREFLTDSKWGRKESYHLMINTSDIVIKEIIPSVADYARHWFEVNHDK